MNERESARGVTLYNDVLDMIPAADLPVSRDDYEILLGRRSDWHEDFCRIHQRLVKEYGDSAVRATRLHHILSGSS